MKFTLGNVIASLIILFSTAMCSSGYYDPGTTQSASTVNPITTSPFDTTSTTASTAACTNFTATIQQQGVANPALVTQNTTVVWQVNITANGCTNLDVIRIDNGTEIPVGSQTSVVYSKTYSTLSSNMQESVKVVSVDANGNPLGTPLVVSSQAFSVVPATTVTSSGAITCTLTGTLTGSLNNEFTLNLQLSRPGLVVGVTNGVGQILTSPDPTKAAEASNFTFQAWVSNAGNNSITAQVEDPTQAGVSATCSTVVYVNPNLAIIYPPVTTTPVEPVCPPPVVLPMPPALPPAPTCNIELSTNQINPGGPITITVNTSGIVNPGPSLHSVAIALEGLGPIAYAGSFTVNPGYTGTFIAAVFGPGGAGLCTAGFSVVPNQTQTILCFTNSNTPFTCNTGGPIVSYSIASQAAGSQCSLGKNYGVTANNEGIWVEKGCNARFNVTYQTLN